uniref:Cytochrom_C_asm domain-containing protein n=1 Tax=Gongylonema pulchrum TaxID=637853 RepID=A0A183D704_9BILA
LNIIAGPNTGLLQLDTTDRSILQKTNKMSRELILDVCWKHRLQLSRIQYLRLCAVSLWTFSSFAIRNVITAETASHFHGILWFPDLLQPDPYYVVPVLVSALGILNYFAQQRIYGISTTKMTRVINAAYCLVMATGVYFMSHLPVVRFLFLFFSRTG